MVTLGIVWLVSAPCVWAIILMGARSSVSTYGRRELLALIATSTPLAPFMLVGLTCMIVKAMVLAARDEGRAQRRAKVGRHVSWRRSK